MHQIQNADIKVKISEDVHATNPANMPSMLPDYVVPILLINDPVYYANDTITASGTAINSTATTIHTTDSVKDTYLTGASLGVIKDSTGTSVLSAIDVVIGGATKNILTIPGLTLTAQSESVSATFNPPIKVDRSSIIRVTNSTATANTTCAGSVTGFLRRRN